MAYVTRAEEQRKQALRPLFAYLDRWGITRSWLARQLHMPRARVWSYEHGKVNPPAGFVEDACRALGVTPERFGWTSTPRTTGRARKVS